MDSGTGITGGGSGYAAILARCPNVSVGIKPPKSKVRARRRRRNWVLHPSGPNPLSWPQHAEWAPNGRSKRPNNSFFFKKKLKSREKKKRSRRVVYYEDHDLSEVGHVPLDVRND